MSSKADWFRVGIRVVFLGAYGAFLWASIHHIAYFFHSFEPTDIDWNGAYWLAIAIDVTGLVLTIGVMFFRKNMHPIAFGFVCFFILFLTALSWLMNYEYAARFQRADLTSIPWLVMLNPIIASSFAFLNVAYALIAEAFSTKPATALELAQEADRLEALEAQQKRIDAYHERNKKTGLIERAKEMAKELKQAVSEVAGNTSTVITSTVKPEQDTTSSVNISMPSDDTIEESHPIEAENEMGIPSPSMLENLGNDKHEEEQTDITQEDTASRPAISGVTVSFEEAAELTGYSVGTLRKYASLGKVRCSKRDKNLLLLSSLVGMRNKTKSRVTQELPAVKLVPLPVQSEAVSNGKH